MVSLTTRIISTVVVVFCWLIFVISFLAFYPTGFDIWQNIAFFIVSGLTTCAIIALIWIRMIPI
ncbi:MAG: hypothetical protein JSW72_03900 [Candidatus Bathyarchaeota archaeon]|nr:MAG: hypothetical protein JSW72_03900 [Candidatus Bathyarchaeota archaeon]